MGDLSTIAPAERLSVTIEVPLHWQDHHHQGSAVLPAVEAMQLLAHWVGERYPSVDTLAIRQARFDKFLPLPASGTVNGFCEMAPLERSGLRASLLTRVATKTGKMTRTMVHAVVDFGSATGKGALRTAHDAPAWSKNNVNLVVTPETIYTELVPFGPAFGNISEPLHLYPDGALAHIVAPDLSDHQTGQPLGSPFVLDAAFHAACVWSQRYAGIVAFPIAIEERRIQSPARPGQRYTARVLPVRSQRLQLAFDMEITDEKGQIVENVTGLQMRDVSSGRLKPPAWIRHDP